MSDSAMDAALAKQGAFKAIGAAIWSAAHYGMMAKPHGYEDPNLPTPEPRTYSECKRCGGPVPKSRWRQVCNECRRDEARAELAKQAYAHLPEFLVALGELSRRFGMIVDAPYHSLSVYTLDNEGQGADAVVEDDIDWNGERYVTSAETQLRIYRKVGP